MCGAPATTTGPCVGGDYCRTGANRFNNPQCPMKTAGFRSSQDHRLVKETYGKLVPLCGSAGLYCNSSKLQREGKRIHPKVYIKRNQN